MKQGGITPWRDKDEVLTCSTPLLFTPYHGHKSVTLGSYDVKGPSRRSSKWLSPLSPATPSFLGNTLTPGLHEGASMQSLKSKDDSFLLQFKENSVIDPRNVSSQPEQWDFLQDTPVIFKDSSSETIKTSSFAKHNRDISGRSLDRLLDPDVPVSWTEAMATPSTKTDLSKSKSMDKSKIESDETEKATVQDEPIEQSISKDQEFINEDQQKKIIASREKEKFLTKKAVARTLFNSQTHNSAQSVPDSHNQSDESVIVLEPCLAMERAVSSSGKSVLSSPSVALVKAEGQNKDLPHPSKSSTSYVKEPKRTMNDTFLSLPLDETNFTSDDDFSLSPPVVSDKSANINIAFVTKTSGLGTSPLDMETLNNSEKVLSDAISSSPPVATHHHGTTTTSSYNTVDHTDTTVSSLPVTTDNYGTTAVFQDVAKDFYDTSSSSPPDLCGTISVHSHDTIDDWDTAVSSPPIAIDYHNTVCSSADTNLNKTDVSLIYSSPPVINRRASLCNQKKTISNFENKFVTSSKVKQAESSSPVVCKEPVPSDQMTDINMNMYNNCARPLRDFTKPSNLESETILTSPISGMRNILSLASEKSSKKCKSSATEIQCGISTTLTYSHSTNTDAVDGQTPLKTQLTFSQAFGKTCDDVLSSPLLNIGQQNSILQKIQRTCGAAIKVESQSSAQFQKATSDVTSVPPLSPPCFHSPDPVINLKALKADDEPEIPDNIPMSPPVFSASEQRLPQETPLTRKSTKALVTQSTPYETAKLPSFSDDDEEDLAIGCPRSPGIIGTGSARPDSSHSPGIWSQRKNLPKKLIISSQDDRMIALESVTACSLETDFNKDCSPCRDHNSEKLSTDHIRQFSHPNSTAKLFECCEIQQNPRNTNHCHHPDNKPTVRIKSKQSYNLELSPGSLCGDPKGCKTADPIESTPVARDIIDELLEMSHSKQITRKIDIPNSKANKLDSSPGDKNLIWHPTESEPCSCNKAEEVSFDISHKPHSFSVEGSLQHPNPEPANNRGSNRQNELKTHCDLKPTFSSLSGPKELSDRINSKNGKSSDIEDSKQYPVSESAQVLREIENYETASSKTSIAVIQSLNPPEDFLSRYWFQHPQTDLVQGRFSYPKKVQTVKCIAKEKPTVFSKELKDISDTNNNSDANELGDEDLRIESDGKSADGGEKPKLTTRDTKLVLKVSKLSYNCDEIQKQYDISNAEDSESIHEAGQGIKGQEENGDKSPKVGTQKNIPHNYLSFSEIKGQSGPNNIEDNISLKEAEQKSSEICRCKEPSRQSHSPEISKRHGNSKNDLDKKPTDELNSQSCCEDNAEQNLCLDDSLAPYCSQLESSKAKPSILETNTLSLNVINSTGFSHAAPATKGRLTDNLVLRQKSLNPVGVHEIYQSGNVRSMKDGSKFDKHVSGEDKHNFNTRRDIVDVGDYSQIPYDALDSLTQFAKNNFPSSRHEKSKVFPSSCKNLSVSNIANVEIEDYSQIPYDEFDNLNEFSKDNLSTVEHSKLKNHCEEDDMCAHYLAAAESSCSYQPETASLTTNFYSNDKFVQQLLVSCCDKSVKVSAFKGFKTGSGKKIEISDEALQAAMLQLREIEENLEYSHQLGNKKPCGAQRPHMSSSENYKSKSIKSLAKSLPAANFEVEKANSSIGEKSKNDISMEASLLNVLPVESGNDVAETQINELKYLEAGNGEELHISQGALEKTKSNLETVAVQDSGIHFSGFITDNGPQVKLPESALKKATSNFSEMSDNDMCLISDGNTVKNSQQCFRSSLTETSKNVNAAEYLLDKSRSEINSEIGNDPQVFILNEPYNHANVVVSELSIGIGKTTNVPNKLSNGVMLPVGNKTDITGAANKESGYKESFQGFVTGNGRRIKVTKTALDKARSKLDVLSDEEFMLCSVSKPIDSFSVDNFGDANEQPTHRINSKGFVTGSAKMIKISETALEKARSRLDCEIIPGIPPSLSRLNDTMLEPSHKNTNQEFSSGNLLTKQTKSGFNGLITASGKKVPVSKKALDQAIEKLNSVTDESLEVSSENVNRHSEFTGFATASAKNVSVSNNALELPTKKLASITEENSGNVISEETYPSCNGVTTASGKNITDFRGFVTGSGKKICVSKDALDQAREKLAAVDDHNLKTTPKNVTSKNTYPDFSGFITGNGKKVCVSKNALNRAKQKLATVNDPDLQVPSKSVPASNTNPGFSGFVTGSGNKVSVSKDALEQARGKLAAIDCDNVQASSKSVPAKNTSPGFSGFVTGSGKKVSVSKDALDQAREKLATTDYDNLQTSSKSVPARNTNPGFSGFVTGSGKKVSVSKDALDQAREKLAAVDSDNLQISSKSAPAKNIKPGFSGFVTGSGKKVSVSKDALDQAREKLAAVDSDNLQISSKSAPAKNIEPGFSGFVTGSGKKVSVSKDAMHQAREKLDSINCDHLQISSKSVPAKNTNPGFNAFVTGSGKKVSVSKDVLDQAREKLAAIDCDNLQISLKSVPAKNTNPGFSGFVTGSGKKVTVSKDALDQATEKLAIIDCDNQQTSSKSVPARNTNPGFSGFVTGSGKKVSVSKDALDQAKEKLMAVDNDTVQASSRSILARNADPGFGGFVTGTEKTVCISKKALDQAKEKLSLGTDDNLGISSESHLFDTLNCGLLDPDISGNSVKEHDPSGMSIVQSGMNTTQFQGFFTGHGEKVKVSKQALDQAEAKFISLDPETSNEFEKERDSFGVSVSQFGVNPSQFKGFVTGHGDRANISEQALNRMKAVSLSPECGISNGLIDKHSAFGIPTIQSNVRCSNIAKVPKQMDKDFEHVMMMLGNDKKENAVKTSEDSCMLNVKRKRFSVAKRLPFSGRVVYTEKMKDCNEYQTSNVRPVEDLKKLGNDSDSQKRYGAPVNCHAEPLPKYQKSSTDHVLRGEDFSEPEKKLLRRNNKLHRRANTTTPAGYQCDRIAKLTAPLQTLKTTVLEKETPLQAGVRGQNSKRLFAQVSKSSESTRHSSGPRSGVNTNGKSAKHSPEEKGNIRKSFNTPFKKGDVPEEATSDRESPASRERMKRPLYTCVPFGKRRKLDSESTSGVKEQIDPVRPKAGQLFLSKQKYKSIGTTLRKAVDGQPPRMYTKEQLYELGIHGDVVEVTSENATKFRFNKDYFGKETLKKGVAAIGDGAQLQLASDSSAGLEEFTRAFLCLPGVDKSLISDKWCENHYRWIVWKLASYEASFPDNFGGSCLLPHSVMCHLKYRYDKEIDKAERPALKKILERDDIASRRLVLCVSHIYSESELRDDTSTNNEENHQQSNKGKSPNKLFGRKIIELTDGWYPIKTVLDQPLSYLLTQKKIFVGLKLCTYGAEIIGSEQGCSPLEAPSSLMLQLHANSTRRAQWDAKLGYQTDRWAFPTPLYSLFPDGGMVGCLDVVVLRAYPMQWMEKSSNGSGCVFRNTLQEEKAKKKYEDDKHMRMEKLYNHIQKEFEKNSYVKDTRKSRRRSAPASFKEISKLRSGQELYDVLFSSVDPATLESSLSESQKLMLTDYKRQQDDRQRGQLQRKFEDAWKELQEQFPERVVLRIQKFRICDYSVAEGKERKDAIITVWKPTEDILESWKEGTKLRLFNLSASQSRYKHVTSSVQLATMKCTRYEVIERKPKLPFHIYAPRQVYSFQELSSFGRKIFKEVDFVGVIVHITQHGVPSESQTVYLADDTNTFISVKFWGGLKAFKIEDLVRPGSLVTFTNLLWKAEDSQKNILYMDYTDLCTASRNPKESYLRGAMKDLEASIKDIQLFVREKRSILDSILRSGSRGVLLGPRENSPMCYNSLKHGTLQPTMNKTYGQTKCTPMQSSEKLTDEMPPSEKGTPDTMLEQRRINATKRKSLLRYGEPPPIGPLLTRTAPGVRRDYKSPILTKK